MPKTRDNIKGHKCNQSPVALLLIDLINDLEFEGGEKLIANILPLAKNIVRLKKAAKLAGAPVIYVNDNFGKWQSDFKKLLSHCIENDLTGTPLVSKLQPEADDYFVLKPKHSGFYSTTLDILLSYLRTTTLIMAGVTGDFCILFTASDAYMREYKLFVPSDCVASEDPKLNKAALDLMKRRFDVNTTPSTRLDLKKMFRKAAKTKSRGN